MLKPSVQLQMQLASQQQQQHRQHRSTPSIPVLANHNNNRLISQTSPTSPIPTPPQDNIIRPKPRRMTTTTTTSTSSSSNQLSRHCTSVDLRSSPPQQHQQQQQQHKQQCLPVLPHQQQQQRETPPVSNGRPNTPLSPIRRDLLGGSAPVLSHLMAAAGAAGVGNRSSPRLSLSPFQPSVIVDDSNSSGGQTTPKTSVNNKPMISSSRTSHGTPPKPARSSYGRNNYYLSSKSTPMLTTTATTASTASGGHHSIYDVDDIYDVVDIGGHRVGHSVGNVDDDDDDDDGDYADNDYYDYYYEPAVLLRQQQQSALSYRPSDGSLSTKSSSTTDGTTTADQQSAAAATAAAVNSKRKVLSKMKSRRRNILCFGSTIPTTPTTPTNEYSSQQQLSAYYPSIVTPNSAVTGGKANNSRQPPPPPLLLQANGWASSGDERVSASGKGGGGHRSLSSSGHASMSSGTDTTNSTDRSTNHHTGANTTTTTTTTTGAQVKGGGDPYACSSSRPSVESSAAAAGLRSRKAVGSHHREDSIFSRAAAAAGMSAGHMAAGTGGMTSLEGVRAAIEQMSLRTQGGHSTSTYSSYYSGSDYEPITGNTFRHRLKRYSSMETVGTNVTTNAADDFVWVDTHSRLVELQHYPWDTQDVLRLIREGRLRQRLRWISMDCLPRLSYLLQRPLIRIASEAQRLAKPLGICTKHEIAGAIRIVFGTQLADTCVKSGHRAAAIFAVSVGGGGGSCPVGSGDYSQWRQSKQTRAGLQLSVGQFHRWMCDVRMGQFVDEVAAIYMTAAVENLVEEIIIHCLQVTATTGAAGATTADGSSGGCGVVLTAQLLDTCVANNPDLWGVLQPFAHLIAGRTANGALGLSPALSAAVDMIGSDGGCGGGIAGSSSSHDDNNGSQQLAKQLEQKLLTTCVGSVQQLAELIDEIRKYRLAMQPSAATSGGQQQQRKSGQTMWWSQQNWSLGGLHSLYYYMRCAQLEHQSAVVAAANNTADGQSSSISGGGVVGQELVYERPYLVLPPLYEWMRVSAAQAYYRRSPVVDRDDLLQAARLLLPGVDCPPRPLSTSLTNSEEWLYWRRDLDSTECTRRLKTDLAFRMLGSGRSDIVQQAVQLLPANYGLNTVNDSGLTALMLAIVDGNQRLVQLLVDSGHCNVNVETPAPQKQQQQYKNRQSIAGTGSHISTVTQYWTALCYACARGQREIAEILLAAGARVEGGYRYGDDCGDRPTQTPLQLAAGGGHTDLVRLLLSYGADPYLSTERPDQSAAAHCTAARGCPPAISVAAMHGQRWIVRALLAQQTTYSTYKDVLSLEEMLAESSGTVGGGKTRATAAAVDKSRMTHGLAANHQSSLPSLNVMSLMTSNNTTSDCNTGANNSCSNKSMTSTTTTTIDGNSSCSNISNTGANSSSVSSSSSSTTTTKTSSNNNNKVIQLTKTKLRVLQEAMYHSAETGCLEITLDLRNLGIPWTLHTWMQTVITAHGMRLEAITDQLLRDFMHMWSDSDDYYYSLQFIDECLPLLFSLLRYQTPTSDTALLLADIISTCFGKRGGDERVGGGGDVGRRLHPNRRSQHSLSSNGGNIGPPIGDSIGVGSSSCGNGSIQSIDTIDLRMGARIDAKYVNNRDMSDCTFKVEGRVFYAHKIILVNASQWFQTQLQPTGAAGAGVGHHQQQQQHTSAQDISKTSTTTITTGTTDPSSVSSSSSSLSTTASPLRSSSSISLPPGALQQQHQYQQQQPPHHYNYHNNNNSREPIVINNIRFDIFQKVMQFLYNGGFDLNTDVDQNDILELMSAASYFQLDGLLRYCSRRCCDYISHETVSTLYMNAIQFSALELMQHCQRYILENMVTLLANNQQLGQLLLFDSTATGATASSGSGVGKLPNNNTGAKHHNHQQQQQQVVQHNRLPDHLTALLFTLQQRCRDRQQQQQLLAHQRQQHQQQHKSPVKNHLLK